MENYCDHIPLEESFTIFEPDETGMISALFYAFNTVITLQAFGTEEACRKAFDAVRNQCRYFEHVLSRTLPHSDIALLNVARGAEVPLHVETYEVLCAAQHYSKASQGCFDITMGTVVRLWNFTDEHIPAQHDLENALAHVDWRTLELRESNGRYFARLTDPETTIDVGGMAKGYIADKLTATMIAHGLKNFIVNLGGNAVAHGRKPNGNRWRIGLQDPQNKNRILQAVEVENASAVTSGIYERCFTAAGRFYHHILSTTSGMPVETDVTGVTIVAPKSIDCDGFSTTLLALGMKRGIAFARQCPEITQAYFVDRDNKITSIY
ncbi:MAG: FAD:protein FMN transferase [Raoultibacter sp.]